MNWKQFLKPDWRKTLLFILILFAIVFLLPVSTYAGPCALPPSNCPNQLSISDIVKIYGLSEALMFLILGAVFSYIISCLIVWIYGKIRKK